jgi:hypothetical protein
MPDLCCARCGRVLVEEFWVLLGAETVTMFSSLSFPCCCGHTTRIEQLNRRRWLKLAEAQRIFAAA